MSESPSQPPGPTRDGKISTTLIDHDHLCRMVAANIRGSSADREVAEQPGAAPGNSLVGRSIDRYRIEAEIGRGGMSVVYRALDTTLERPVAVKVIQERYQNKGLPERLRREATLSARLTHPNIIAVHDLGEWRLGDPPHPAPYIVMDLVDGGTFRDAFDRLPISSRLEILQRIAQAVGHAHEQGVIHRDLKPSNILLRKDGWPLLADFGLAREAIDLSRWTRTGEVLGTPDYMAPEQVRGERDRVGPATDIWALGVLTYEALTDHLPFRAPHPGQVLQAILQDNPVPVRRLVPGIPEPLEAICRRALDKDLERRFGSAREFSGALEHWIAGESDPIHSLTALDRTGILTPLEPSDPRSAGGQAIASPRRSRIQWLVAGAGSVLLLLALMLALRPGEPENQIPGPVPDDLLWRMKHELVVDPDASLRVLGSLEDHLLVW